MEKVNKLYFDPLLRVKHDVESFVKTLPIGSAHVFNTELLVHAPIQGQITSIDISMHNEDYFSNAVNLGDLGDEILDRMKLFPALAKFNDEYTVQQAPASTFRVPIVDDSIHIFAVSQTKPTYFDLCLGRSDRRTSCYDISALSTFEGLRHSGDVNSDSFLLQHIQISSTFDADKPCAVFVSGYEYNLLHTYKAHNPLVLVANHEIKVLYIIPVPLDSASIGAATICCPLVIKKDADGFLVCSILSAPAIDVELMCSGTSLNTEAFATAIERANFTKEPERQQQASLLPVGNIPSTIAPSDIVDGADCIIAAHSVTLPRIYREEATQIIRFGRGLHWMTKGQTERAQEGSLAVLPIILGDVLQGPMVLALGEGPTNVPFRHAGDLRRYYEQAKSILVVVDDKMPDNVRNVATTWRLNGVFIVQTGGPTPDAKADISTLLDAVNINAVTSLAGPQSLILVQMGNKFYFYRGLADQSYLDTSKLEYGQELTNFICHEDMMLSKLLHPSWPRLVDLSKKNPVYLPKMNQTMQLSALEDALKTSSISQLGALKDDVICVVPQLQVLLRQEELQKFCSALLKFVEDKVKTEVESVKNEYRGAVLASMKAEEDVRLRKERERLLGILRSMNREALANLQWLTGALGNIVSTQTTSSRSHDLKRLVRQAKIADNVTLAKSLDFQQLGAMLEQHAEKMGVLLVNIDESKYERYLEDNLYLKDISAGNDVCSFDPRTLHLNGMDASILLPMTQEEHHGPLVSDNGPQTPILALGNLNPKQHGSTLAWVCWDEFVSLDNPYKVRWMEKCNDVHIAAARIIMRGTLSEAVSSRNLSLAPMSPATGHLLAALLMTTMQKLASSRSIPISKVNPEDTTTMLMRGLFGNLLTTAGSGSTPMSFVWQLFGLVPNFDIPSTIVEWNWYETVTRLLPYTGWSTASFKQRLAHFLNKLIFRMMTNNEISGAAAAAKKNSLGEYCKARDIQLLHSRTIITVLKKLNEQEDCKDAAKRLLENIPEHIEHQSESYRRLHRYIVHLAGGGAKRSDDNLVAASVFIKRACPLQEAKQELCEQAKQITFTADDLVANFDGTVWEKIVRACHQLFDTISSIEKEWGLKPESVKYQNIKNIQQIYEEIRTGSGNGIITKKQISSFQGDAETTGKPWQIEGGKYSTIEALDTEFMNKILLGDRAQEGTDEMNLDSHGSTAVASTTADILGAFKDVMKPDFIGNVKRARTYKDVCHLLNITPGAMEAFAQMLSPGFELETLPEKFKEIVIMLLKDRSREGVKAAEKLFGVTELSVLEITEEALLVEMSFSGTTESSVEFSE